MEIAKIVSKLNEIASLTKLYRELKSLLYSDIPLPFRTPANPRFISIDVGQRTYKRLHIDVDAGAFRCVETIFKFDKIEIEVSRMFLWFRDRISAVSSKALQVPIDLMETMCNMHPEDLDKAMAIVSDDETKRVLQKLKEIIAVASTVLDP